MFLSFNTTEERRSFGGSAFLEIQYCKILKSKPLKRIVPTDSIKNWDNSSLYVYDDDIKKFYDEYAEILQNGVYNNLCEGKLDTCGINYYSSNRVKDIIERLKSAKPTEYDVLLEWLNNSLSKNGFYILGI